MGLTRATPRLTNLFNGRQVETEALVDTGEAGRQAVTLADGHQRKVPKIAPVEIAFENRSYVTGAPVSGNEPLPGGIPLEAMDLVIDPRRQTLAVNPRHPNYQPVTLKQLHVGAGLPAKDAPETPISRASPLPQNLHANRADRLLPGGSGKIAAQPAGRIPHQEISDRPSGLPVKRVLGGDANRS